MENGQQLERNGNSCTKDAESKKNIWLYGLLKGMKDDALVRFKSDCVAVAISRFPLPLNSPTLLEVKNVLIQQGLADL